ncbi:unnamed protein product [Dibothriocephalus latus]|uniref:P-type ATPase C-terminal domain-containing protein n=1 Tax=Dibothriocephalus latus TaxID=60516 RepID=A0A3P7LYM9_DIBLA|nr:unnamed protein product [Dibothriocephalus latus]
MAWMVLHGVDSVQSTRISRNLLYTSGPLSVLYLNFFYLDTSPAFWLSIPLAVVLALLPDILWRLASDAWWDHQIALSGVKREKERRKRRARRRFFTTEPDGLEETALDAVSMELCPHGDN